MDNQQDRPDFSEDLFGVNEYAVIKPKNRVFLPWHKPRKQYVRDIQWLGEVNKLVNDRSGSISTLKYLGLPGTDLLDLRFFHRHVCQPKGIRFQFLGFNSAARPDSPEQQSLNISLDEVRKMSLVDELSDVIPDNFEDVGVATSLARRRTVEIGPYDIINVDLCDSFASERPGVFHRSHYSALNTLLGIQTRRPDPWLLFLTTRAGKRHAHRDVYSKFVDLYKGNLESCEKFRNASQGYNGVKAVIDLENALKRSSQGVDLDVFVIGICKWLLTTVLSQNPPVTMELCSVISYRVIGGMGEDDLVSLALKFTPSLNPVQDPLFLAAPTIAPSECEIAHRFIGTMSRRFNADNELNRNAALKMRMINAMKDLLLEARYSGDDYLAWVNMGCPTQLNR